MTGIDRDALIRLIGDDVYDTNEQFADRILALERPAEPVAFTPDRVRAELLASLPADPKWVAWVDGVLDRLEVVEGVTLTPEEAAYARIWLPTANSQRARDLAARLEASS